MVGELTEFSCTTIDAPGHGESSDGKRTLQQCGDDIGETMPGGALVGYSMGARMSLHTALQRPDKVDKLVLVSGTAGIDDEVEREQRRLSDNTLADRIEAIGVPAFISEWLANPMFAGLSADSAQIDQRLLNSPEGLADSLRHAGTGTQTPLWDKLSDLSIPVLIVAGEHDKKFTQLAQRMHRAIPHSEIHIVERSGHTVHLENHAEFVRLLKNFLS